jgi:hypothetical protein
MTLDTLRRVIIDAFSEVSRPTGMDLAPHPCDECDQVRALLGAHAFTSAPDEVLDHLGDSLPLLAPAGLHYYLPAYLLRALHDPKFEWLDFLLFHLGPSDSDLSQRGNYWSERLAVFSVKQRSAVRAFLEWLAGTTEGADYAEELARANAMWAETA